MLRQVLLVGCTYGLGLSKWTCSHWRHEDKGKGVQNPHEKRGQGGSYFCCVVWARCCLAYYWLPFWASWLVEVVLCKGELSRPCP